MTEVEKKEKLRTPENHKPLPGTQKERIAEALVRTIEQVLERMYTEIPMSELDKEANALHLLTRSWIELEGFSKSDLKFTETMKNIVDLLEQCQDLLARVTEVNDQATTNAQNVGNLIAGLATIKAQLKLL